MQLPESCALLHLLVSCIAGLMNQHMIEFKHMQQVDAKVLVQPSCIKTNGFECSSLASMTHLVSRLVKWLQAVAEQAFDPFDEDLFAEDGPAPHPAGYDPFQEDDDMDVFGLSSPGHEATHRQPEAMPNDDPFGEDIIFPVAEIYGETNDWAPASSDGDQQGLILSPDVRISVENVLELITSLAETLGESDSGLLHISKTMDAIWTALLTHSGGSQPQFIFKDGPVVEAAVLGYQLLLEDLDAPSQAVTERLNSILETERSFRVTENLLMADQPEIGIHTHFQVFATTHQHHSQQPLKLSPAIRSRFTEILISGYTASEIREVAMQELQDCLSANADTQHLVHQLFALRALTAAPGSTTSDIHRLMRWIHFICNHSSEVSLTRRLLLGARFCYLLPGETMIDQLQASWSAIFGASPDLTWAQR